MSAAASRQTVQDMHISTLLFAAREAQGADLQLALVSALQGIRTHLPALREAHVHLVLRHVATDSVRPGHAAIPVVPRCDQIRAIVECGFDHAATAATNATLRAWARFLAEADKFGALLYVMETTSIMPIPLTRQAVDGGFRRWMPLRRAAAEPVRFRDEWFGRHARLVRDLPFVDGYLQNLVLSRHGPDRRNIPYVTLPVDGIAQLCFAGEAQMLAAYASDARQPLREDGRLLLAGVDTLLVQGVAAFV